MLGSGRVGVRSGVVLGVLVALVVAGISLSAPAQAATKRKVTVGVSSSSVVVGARVTVKGKVTKSRKGTKVVLQRAAGGRWVKVKTVKTTTRSGKYSYTFTAARVGSTTYRAVAPRTRTGKKATSRTVSVLVRVAPVNLLTLASQRATGGYPGTGSVDSDISADGRFVVFTSYADNLVANDTNSESDVFLRDMQTRVTTLVSRVPGGPQGNDPSSRPSISANGRYIAFDSLANNLSPDDGNAYSDVYVLDRATNVLSLASRASGAGGAVSDGGSISPSVSDNGRVAFASNASNIAGTHGGVSSDVFVRDVVAKTTVLVSSAGLTTAAADQPSFSAVINAAGTSVVFVSNATNLDGTSTNAYFKVYRRVLASGAPVLISKPNDGNMPDGASREPDVSADGRYVAYESNADNLAGGAVGLSDIFVTDAVTGATTLISRPLTGAGISDLAERASISGDGKYVAFSSAAGNLVTGDTGGTVDVFVTPRVAGPARVASRTYDGLFGSDTSTSATLSGDGRFAAFESLASNLTPGDAPGTSDVFRWDARGNR